MNEAPQAIPLCPITGLPAVRLIQPISSNLLNGLWRASFRVETDRQLGTGRTFGLWESGCGLVFFDPPIAGDSAFYRDLYARFGRDGPWAENSATREDYARAAAMVRPGERVLDVGCGPASFAAHVPHASYVGLDDNYPAAGDPAAGIPVAGAADIRNETLAAHAAANAGTYDVVCAFHVAEHVPQPATFAADLARCLRPGGALVLAVPKFPSAINDIPNFVFNAPPHHLTWWNEQALRALAQSAGLEVQSLEGLPLGAHHRLGHWMGRVVPALTGKQYFRHAKTWHGALFWSFAAGRLCAALLGTPRRAKPVELLLIACKPLAA
jgi:2-polyprenyl-3-methyl-5-hydroxy-6-metoxy-1,4-benzoquinol methylase